HSLISAESSSNLRLFIIIGITLQCLLLLSRLIHLSLIETTLYPLWLSYAAVSALGIFLYWNIGQRRNWARMLWLVFFFYGLHSLPTRMIHAFPIWAFRSPKILILEDWLLNITSLIYGLILAVHLNLPKVRKLFGEKPIAIIELLL